MIDERVLLGYPIDFKDICQIYPPTVNDVVKNKEFSIYQALLTITQEELNDEYRPKQEEGFSLESINAPIEGVPFAMRMQLDNKPSEVMVPTPFQYLMINYYQNEEMQDIIQNAFVNFVHEPVTIVPEIDMLLIGKSEDDLDPDVDLDNPRLITAEDYFDFQNAVRIVLGESVISPPDEDEDENVARIKRKNRESRRKIAKMKKPPTLGTLLTAICCMGIGLSPLNIGEMSYACVSWLTAMAQQKEEYDTDIRALLAGADSKKVKPRYWIKNID